MDRVELVVNTIMGTLTELPIDQEGKRSEVKYLIEEMYREIDASIERAEWDAFRATLHTVPTTLEHLIRVTTIRATNAAVEMLMSWLPAKPPEQTCVK